MASKKRIGVISLGCAKNLVDTEVMLGHLDLAGCTIVQDLDEAEVVLVNTCGFIDSAREESINTIMEAAALKKTGNLRKLVVAGCMVQRYRDELRENLPEVDAFIGLDELERVGSAVTGTLPMLPSPAPAVGERSPVVSKFLYDDASPRVISTHRWTAFVKIAEGCNHSCTFCAIPSFKGDFRSREIASVVREVRKLVDAGVREVNLIAQDSSRFGADLGMTDGLPDLLEALDGIERLRWIRVHYLYPNTVTTRLIDTMAGLPRVVPYVDIPLQHADQAVLGRMGRGGAAESHLRLLDRFRDRMPGAAIRSTFIVGFPGESDEEFRTLRRFIREAEFEHLGVFTYSHETGTGAYELEDDIPAELKVARRDELMRLQQQMVEKRQATLIGRTVEVLLEGVHPETEHLLIGRMSTQAPEVDGAVLINEGTGNAGEFVSVELTDTAGYDIVGRIRARTPGGDKPLPYLHGNG